MMEAFEEGWVRAAAENRPQQSGVLAYAFCHIKWQSSGP